MESSICQVVPAAGFQIVPGEEGVEGFAGMMMDVGVLEGGREAIEVEIWGCLVLEGRGLPGRPPL